MTTHHIQKRTPAELLTSIKEKQTAINRILDALRKNV